VVKPGHAPSVAGALDVEAVQRAIIACQISLIGAAQLASAKHQLAVHIGSRMRWPRPAVVTKRDW